MTLRLRVAADGRRLGHGQRCHADPSHPLYLARCARIAGALAERFGGHPAVIGWQVCNEFGDISFADDAKPRFLAWLRARHGDLATLNRRWATEIWSQEYGDWDDVPFAIAGQNACLALAVMDWQTAVWREYLRVQAEAIRARLRAPRFVTTNFTYDYAKQDPHALAPLLDLAAVDPYVAQHQRLDPAAMGFYLAVTRGIRRAPFWVMETQPGFVNWAPPNAALPPGEVRRMVYHQLGQGADAVLFWQWRASRAGQEQYHGSLVHACGRPRPLYAEMAAIGAELARLRPRLAGSRVETPVALLWRQRDRVAIGHQRHHGDFDPWRHAFAHFGALRRLGLDVDVVDPGAGLAGYRLAVAPALHLLDQGVSDALLAWVRAGGHLVLGPRSGFADAHGAVHGERQPGAAFADALGARVEEWYALAAPVQLAGDGLAGSAAVWGEWLEPEAAGCAVALRYGDGQGWLRGRAALVERAHGAGRIALLGTWPDPGLLTALSARWCAAAGVATPWAPLAPGLEVATRSGPGGRLHIVCNHADAPRTLQPPQRLRCLLRGCDAAGLALPAGEVAVLAPG